MAGFLEHHDDALQVVNPLVPGSWVAVVEVDLGALGEILGMHQQLAIIARGDGNPHIEFNRDWHNEALVVVGMFANQIDASRRPKHASVRAVALAKAAPELRCDGCFVCDLHFHTLRLLNEYLLIRAVRPKGEAAPALRYLHSPSAFPTGPGLPWSNRKSTARDPNQGSR